MHEPACNGLSDNSALKYLSPAAKRQIGGNNRTHPAMSGTENLEEEIRGLFIKREESQLIDYVELHINR